MKANVILAVSLFMLFTLGATLKADTEIVTYEPNTKSFQRITVGSYETCIFMGDLFLEKYPDADYICVNTTN